MSILPYLPRWWISFIANAAFVLVTVLGFIVIKTFIPAKPPITVKGGEYSVAKGDEAYVIYYKCQSEVAEEFEAHVHRTIRHTETGESMSLPTTEVKFEPGQNNVTRIFYVPIWLQAGEWCATSTLEWRPFMSLVDHKMVGTPRCFTVPEK
jgi:hypothetical protein